MNAHTSERRYELDWIRIMAILVVFLYHSSRFFNLSNWHIKNINTYAWVEMWTYFAALWMMPLFFVISGASLFFALKKSSGWKKLYSDKFSRLMVPVIFATVTHSALQIYLERITHNQFSGPFLSFLPKYFSGLYLEIGGSGNFAFHGMHLWYLLFLFFYSLICYPLFIWLTRGGYQVLKRITNLFALPGLMYLSFPIPLLMMKLIIPHSVLVVGNGGWGFLYYLWFLIAGFIIASNDRLNGQIKDKRTISLLLAVIFTIFYLYQSFSLSSIGFPAGISPWIYSSFRYISAWCWLLAILGYGTRYLSFNRPILRHLNEGVLPFYILHQTVLLCFGYFIMTMEILDALKWAMVSISSFFVIIGICLVIIQKIDLLRFLFGMKTSQPLFTRLRKRNALIIQHFIYIGLIIFSVLNPSAGHHSNRSPMPVSFDKGKDIILNSNSITNLSKTGIKLVRDDNTSAGQAIEFSTGSITRPSANPQIYAEMRFSAPTGRYIVWLRGKCIKDIYSDSIWLQVDNQIGTLDGRMFGNWLNIHPVDTWAWASDGIKPVAVLLKYSGDHTIRIQPRQTPHRIDQIWLSRFQHRIPDTFQTIK
ncbi:MAG: acyltransferase [Desulfobacteraceae bacterium]|nr:acyltransferase [Desulfobacteraceae bacterium]